MSIEETSATQASAATSDDTNLRAEHTQIAPATTHSPENTAGYDVSDTQPAAAPAPAYTPSTPPAPTGTNPFEHALTEPTPVLPPRPAEEHAMATASTAAEAPDTVANTNVQTPATTASTNVQTNESAQGDVRVNPQVEALRAMFPDFDVLVLYVLPFDI